MQSLGCGIRCTTLKSVYVPPCGGHWERTRIIIAETLYFPKRSVSMPPIASTAHHYITNCVEKEKGRRLLLHLVTITHQISWNATMFQSSPWKRSTNNEVHPSSVWNDVLYAKADSLSTSIYSCTTFGSKMHSVYLQRILVPFSKT